MTSDHDSRRRPASAPFRVVGSEDWRAMLRTGANVFVVGPRCALDAFLAAARSELAEPVRVIGRSDTVPADRQGTLVLCDAAALDERQRHGMLEWLRAPSGARVISLSEVHVWQGDAARSLAAELYYRLNTICLEITD